MAAKFTGLTPTLQVYDLDEAISFYTSLGFEAQWKWPDDQPTHASLRRNGISFMITLQETEKEIQKGDLYFWVDDIESYFHELKRSGIDVPELVKTDYGMLDTSITDPWGHHLSFGSPSGEYEG